MKHEDLIAFFISQFSCSFYISVLNKLTSQSSLTVNSKKIIFKWYNLWNLPHITVFVYWKKLILSCKRLSNIVKCYQLLKKQVWPIGKKRVYLMILITYMLPHAKSNFFKGCHPLGMDLKFIIVDDTYFHHIK